MIKYLNYDNEVRAYHTTDTQHSLAIIVYHLQFSDEGDIYQLYRHRHYQLYRRRLTENQRLVGVNKYLNFIENKEVGGMKRRGKWNRCVF